VLNNLGQVAGTQGDYARARDLHRESLAIREALGDRRSLALPLHNLGVVEHHEGNFEAAERYHREALAIRQSLGDVSAAAYSTCALAHVLHHKGDDEAAHELFHQGILHFREAGDRVGLALSLGGFAEVAREAGRDEEAGAHFVEALTLWQEIGARRSVSCLEEVAALAADGGRGEQATRLLAAATAIRQHIGEPTPPVTHGERRALEERLRANLGDSAFDSIWAAGSSLDPDAAINEAITEAALDTETR
jgi:tetratricopeptide (TPR) repeat protein